jgi:hypothetical protein
VPVASPETVRDWDADMALVGGIVELDVSEGDGGGSPLIADPAIDSWSGFVVGGENTDRLAVLVKVGDVVADRLG